MKIPRPSGLRPHMLPGKIRKFVLAIRRVTGKLHPRIPIGIIRGMTTVVQTASLVFALGTWLVETSLTSRSMEREGKGRGGNQVKLTLNNIGGHRRRHRDTNAEGRWFINID